MFPHQIKQSMVAILVIASISTHIYAAGDINHSADEVVLPEGTLINVAIAKEVTSKEAKPNDPVEFKGPQGAWVHAVIQMVWGGLQGASSAYTISGGNPKV